MALNEQTDMAFGDQPPRVDPVSGNEVPPGALPEEVRDDIPARLSEGEYVVPADVLQYYGIKFFEDLRGKAKMELASMEENGRMGGEPVDDASMEGMDDLPFSAEELNTYDDGQDAPVREFDEGGPVTEMASLNPSTFIKTYINEAGNKLYIRFVNGVAIPPVPPGYTEEGAIVDSDPVDPVADAEQRRLEAEANRDPEQDQSITDGTKPTNRQTVGELLWTIQRSVYKDAFPDSLTAKVFEGGSKAFPLTSRLAGAIKGPTTLEAAVKEAKERLARGKDYQGVAINDQEIKDLNFIIGLENKKGADIYKNIYVREGIHLGFTNDNYTRNIKVPNKKIAQETREKAQVRIDKIKRETQDSDSDTAVFDYVNTEKARKEQQEEKDEQEQNFQEEQTAATNATKDKETPTSSGSAYSGSSGGRREFGMNKGGLASKRKGKNK